MDIAQLVKVLDQPHQAAELLPAWGLRRVHPAQQTLLDLADSGLTLDLLAALCTQLAECLPQTPDPDEALRALARYLFAGRSPLSLVALCERDREALPMLLAALSLGSRWADWLAHDPEAFDLLRQTGGQPLDLPALLGEVLDEAQAGADERQVAAALRRLQRRHALRIAYGETVHRHRFELVTQQLSFLAEALAAAAFAAAQRLAWSQRPASSRFDPQLWSCVALATGRLGAREMDYAGPLQLLIAWDAVGPASELRLARDHFDRVARIAVRLLTAEGEADSTYRVQLIELPDTSLPVAAHAAEDVVLGFDSFGRTWHRQALLDARPIAGDEALGEAILQRLQGWLFRRYLSPPDETGMQAWKRRILLESALHQENWQSVWEARGGLRDLEATVQFLQLLSGGDRPSVRVRGTLAALAGLEQAGVLTVEERTLLENSFVTLRRQQHREQIRRAAAGDSAAERSGELRELLDRSWQALHKLLDSAFAELPPVPREVELLLDPAPPAEEIKAALAPFGFSEPAAALVTLQQLAAEQIPFLSTRRCRHHLAEILPKLLCSVAAMPSPDQTLGNLLRVSDSLGGKGVLWELFEFHPPSLDLYVRLCAASPYLSNILTTNPGMIDELVDSLQLHDLPTPTELQATLSELQRGAPEPLPVVLDFKHAQHLRIGVRDMLGKEDIDLTHAALADVAEVCLEHIAAVEFERLAQKHGLPTIGPGPREGQPCGLVILALGKLGGREPNYHSDLEVAFLYEAEGTTRPPGRSHRDQRTTNNHFFTQLAQRIIKEVGQLTPKGRLFAIEAALRPIGVAGAIALSQADFAQHFASGAAPLWQWQALCKARPVTGEPLRRTAVENLLHDLLSARPWRDEDRAAVHAARKQLERGASPRNLKRGPGGTLDIESLVQLLQLEFAPRFPEVLVTNTQQALQRLAQAGALRPPQAAQLGDAYRFLRRVESGLRLLETPARHDLPEDRTQLARLAILIGHSNPEKLRDQCLALMAQNRALFEEFAGTNPPAADVGL